MFGASFVVAEQTSILQQPAQAAFDDPLTWHDAKRVLFGAFDDLQINPLAANRLQVAAFVKELSTRPSRRGAEDERVPGPGDGSGPVGRER
ncbi:hypothetical protein ACFQ1S_20605 [Kibdelosporangium lantanae]|uniref:Uncharacterized protein n=1 Tax=Kibdelosporangium lantanae TaxID=1497396 RepID=A0ABW3MDI3_9PSEU